MLKKGITSPGCAPEQWRGVAGVANAGDVRSNGYSFVFQPFGGRDDLFRNDEIAEGAFPGSDGIISRVLQSGGDISSQYAPIAPAQLGHCHR